MSERLELQGHYWVALYRISDINQHIQTLRYYGSKCNHITELGVRQCVSSWAFLSGLLDGLGTENKTLVGVDTDYCKEIEDVRRVSHNLGVGYHFHQINDLVYTPEETDLLFIDTWHIYGQLKRELEKYHSYVRKYIILHDTEVDGDLGESIRCGHNIDEQARTTGFPVEEIRRGLKPALIEFLHQHPEFTIKKHFTHNNGLTILKRSF